MFQLEHKCVMFQLEHSAKMVVITLSYSVTQALILLWVAGVPTCRQVTADSWELIEGLPDSDWVWGGKFRAPKSCVLNDLLVSTVKERS
jgi:hypothetical protein